MSDKPLLEDVIDWGQGDDEQCIEIIKAFNDFRNGYYGLCAFSNDNWWEFMNQSTDFNRLMKSEWDRLEEIDFMGIMESMAIILAGGYVRYGKFADGAIKCFEQGNGYRKEKQNDK